MDGPTELSYTPLRPPRLVSACSLSAFCLCLTASPPKDSDKPKGDDFSDGVGKTSGWFPRIYVRNPRPQELKDFQAALGGQDQVEDVLAPPKTWNPDPGPTVRFVDVSNTSEEYRRCIEDFERTLRHPGGVMPGGSTIQNAPCPNLEIVGLRRIENLVLWQSFKAKMQSMKMRAEQEKVSQHRIDNEYMRTNAFHGCAPDCIPLIAQNGFNRSFCGKNATKYGKGENPFTRPLL